VLKELVNARYGPALPSSPQLGYTFTPYILTLIMIGELVND
jgi:hypothetical protein